MEGLDTARRSDISFHIQGLGGDIVLIGNRLLGVQYGLYLPSACFFDFEVLEGVDEEASPSERLNAATWPSSPAVNTTQLCNMSGLFDTVEVESYLLVHIDGSHNFFTMCPMKDDSLREIKAKTTSDLDQVDL